MSRKASILIVFLFSVFSAAFVFGGGSEEQKQAAYPEKPIEFVVCYSAGGGSDINARVIAEIVQKYKFSPEPLLVVNKAGGSGAVGNSYIASKKGEKYTFMTWNSGQMMSTRANKAEVTLDKLTPLANLALDQYMLVVRADSKYKNFKSMVDAVKTAPETVTIGGVSKGSEDHLCFALINKSAGTQFKYVSFNGSGDVMTAVLGGHIDAGIFNPNECLAQIEAGKTLAVAAYSEERLTGAKNVPTFKELGYPGIVFTQFRGIAGPADMPKEAVKYWSDVFKKVSETKEWQEGYCAKNLLDNYYLDAEKSAQFFKSEEDKLVALLKDVGIIK